MKVYRYSLTEMSHMYTHMSSEEVSPSSSSTFLLVLTELCGEDTLHTWLLEHSGERSRKKTKVLDYFKQVATVFMMQLRVVRLFIV